MAKLGDYIRKLREAQGMTLNQLAKVSGLSRSYIGRIELEERRNPSLKAIVRLAAALGIGIEDVCQAAGYMPEGLKELTKNPTKYIATFIDPETLRDLQHLPLEDQARIMRQFANLLKTMVGLRQDGHQ